MVTGFDGFIVLSSWAEEVLPDSGSGGGALMALRGFRLLRIFKLAKKMKTFRVLLKSMLQTVLSMRNFTGARAHDVRLYPHGHAILRDASTIRRG
jgi:hypothetical protein